MCCLWYRVLGHSRARPHSTKSRTRNCAPITFFPSRHNLTIQNLMCRNHHGFFDACLEINLNAGDPRLLFYGASLIQEMRVRGRWPFRADCPISLQGGIPAGDGDGDGDDHNNDNERRGKADPTDRGDNDAGNRVTLPSAVMRIPGQYPNEDTSFSVNAATRQQPQTVISTPTNPFANPAELRALKSSFSQQPNRCRGRNLGK
jgi:hypothetical protein